MRNAVSLLLTAAMLLGILSGCGAAGSRNSSVEEEPPALIISDPDGDEAQFSPAGFQWHFPQDKTTVAVVADAIHPLDENILELDDMEYHPEEDAEYTLSFSRSPAAFRFDRWDIASVGDTQAQCAESAELEFPCLMELRPGSVYVFHAEFADENGCGGDAEYYLVTPEVKDEDEDEDEELGKLPDGDVLGYWQSEEYTAHREAIERSAQVQAEMRAYYSRVLPLLLNGESNSVCSPLNLYLALSMLAETAGGESREALLSALNAPDMEALRQRFALLWAANNYDLAGAKCLLANSLWLSDAIPTREETAGILREVYQADAVSGPMGTEEFDRQIQSWLNEKTGDLLQEFVAGLHTQPETVMELISALYFKAAWADRFSPDATDRAVFHGLNGDRECDMMHAVRTTSYYWGEGFSAVTLPLNEGGTMVFLLPDEGTELRDVISREEAAALLLDRQSYENQKLLRVEMSVPRFDVRGKTDLKDAMGALGLADLFDKGRADFTPLTDVQEVFISSADHAACLSVDEDGVTGAAYTEFAIAASAAPPNEKVEFVLDRPFLFAVTARDGSILFAGTVTDTGE